jgi:hypothetical protein
MHRVAASAFGEIDARVSNPGRNELWRPALPAAANDNTRTPEDHRAITTEQSTTQPKGNTRPYRYTHWPTAERHATEAGGKYMTAALIDWRDFTAQPQVCVANDNFAGDDYEGEEEREPYNYDNRLLQDTAGRTVALYNAGEDWRPEEERFTQGHRNDPGRATVVDTYSMNGTTLYQQDAESEVIRKVDESKTRIRMGHVCCRLLDLASGDSTRTEIAAAVKQPDTPRIDTYVDHAIVAWLRDPAFADYAKAA